MAARNDERVTITVKPGSLIYTGGSSVPYDEGMKVKLHRDHVPASHRDQIEPAPKKATASQSAPKPAAVAE